MSHEPVTRANSFTGKLTQHWMDVYPTMTRRVRVSMGYRDHITCGGSPGEQHQLEWRWRPVLSPAGLHWDKDRQPKTLAKSHQHNGENTACMVKTHSTPSHQMEERLKPIITSKDSVNSLVDTNWHPLMLCCKGHTSRQDTRQEYVTNWHLSGSICCKGYRRTYGIWYKLTPQL